MPPQHGRAHLDRDAASHVNQPAVAAIAASAGLPMAAFTRGITCSAISCIAIELMKLREQFIRTINAAASGYDAMLIERLFSVDIVKRHKPAPQTYAQVEKELGVRPSELCMIPATLGTRSAPSRRAGKRR